MRWRRRKEREQDLERELRSHLELEAEEQREAGLPRDQARYAAQRAFGNTTMLQEEIHEMSPWTSVEQLAQDLRYAVRQFRASPGFTAVIVATLALGIGANTAIFSVLHTVLLRSLPYRDPDRLVVLWQKNLQRQQRDKITPGDYSDWKARSHAFEDMAYYWDTPYTVTGAGNPRTAAGLEFSGNCFSVLGAQPLLGRTFLPEEAVPGRDRVVVLSYRFWQSAFDSDRDVIGRTVQLNGDAHTIVGVMARDFAHPSTIFDIWKPLSLPLDWQNRKLHILKAVARLRPGIDLAQARDELEALAGGNARQYPGTNRNWGVELEPIRESYVGNVKPALWVLQASVLFMLLIACANVANMLMARASAYEREVAIRLALGASRQRLFRQFLMQGLVLSLTGAAAGVLLAFWGVQALPRLFETQLSSIPLPVRAADWMNWPALLLTLAVAMTAAVLFAVIPAVRSRKLSPGALRAGGRGGGERPFAVRLRSSLIVCQVALSLVLLVGSGLLIRSFLRLQDRSFGFETDHLLTFNLVLPPNRYSTAERTSSFLEQTLARIRAVPGVESAGAISTMPLTGNDARRPYTIGGAADPLRAENIVQFRVVTPDYLRAMRIPLRRGRLFDGRDRKGSPEVVMVNEKLARRLWPGQDPIGRTIHVGDGLKPEPREIIGVVGDVRHGGLTEEPPIEVHRPASQAYWPFFSVAARTSLDPMRVMGSVQQALWSVDRDQPINSVRTMESLAASAIGLRRASMLLLAVFSSVAMLLASLGIYSVISYAVTRRTHEIGVRIALGARPGEILRRVVGQGVLLTLAGTGAGLAAASGLTRFLATLLFGVAPTDAVTLGLAIAAMTVVGAAAAYVPARRASRIDPMVALRYE